MKVILPKLEPWQKDVADCLTDIRGSGKIFSVLSSRQCGKSILMAEVLIHFAGNNNNTTSIIVEPTFNQCKNIFETITKWVNEQPFIEKINRQEMSIIFINGSKIICKSCAQRDALRGFTCDFLCIDEACYVTEDIYPIILPWANAKNAPILLVTTPLFREGTFYNFWSNPDGETSFSFDWSTYDKSKYLTAKKLEYFRKTMPKAQFEAEFLGKWIEDGSYCFTNVNACVRKDELKDFKPICCGIDWGTGQGQDYTWLTFFDEDHNAEVVYFNDIDTVKQVDKIAGILNSYNTLRCVQVEKNSIGLVFAEQLKTKLNKKSILKLFTTNNDSKKEIIEDLVTAFSKNELTIPNDPELISQLLHYTVEKTKTGYTYNGLKGYHDDGCMSMGMAYNCFKKKTDYKNKFTIL